MTLIYLNLNNISHSLTTELAYSVSKVRESSRLASQLLREVGTLIPQYR